MYIKSPMIYSRGVGEGGQRGQSPPIFELSILVADSMFSGMRLG